MDYSSLLRTPTEDRAPVPIGCIGRGMICQLEALQSLAKTVPSDLREGKSRNEERFEAHQGSPRKVWDEKLVRPEEVEK